MVNALRIQCGSVVTNRMPLISAIALGLSFSPTYLHTMASPVLSRHKIVEGVLRRIGRSKNGKRPD